jgi:hypothetical protein
MRRIPLLCAVAVAAAGLIAIPPSTHAVDAGCTETNAGYRCLYGPIHIVYGENYPAGIGVVAAEAPPEPGYITSVKATLVDEYGYSLDHHAVHLHHVVWFNPSKEDMTCEGWPDRFFASGKERTKIELPEGYGYYWDNAPWEGPYGTYDPTWLMNYHLDGMHKDHEFDVYVKLTLGFTPASEATLTNVVPVWLDVDNCDDSEYDVAKGSGDKPRSRTKWTYTMPEGGSFVTMAGHLHDYGLRLKLKNLTTGEQMFTSTALYDERPEEKWNLTGMTTYSGVPGIPVAAGDELQLTAVYDNAHAHDDVMGIMIGALVP